MIAAPDFLVRAGELDFFRNRDFRLTEAMAAPERLTMHFASRAGALTCAYRAGPSKLDDLVLTDRVGRILYHAIGALADDPEIDPGQATAIYLRSRTVLKGTLRDFLRNPGRAGPIVATAKCRLGLKPKRSAV